MVFCLEKGNKGATVLWAGLGNHLNFYSRRCVVRQDRISHVYSDALLNNTKNLIVA